MDVAYISALSALAGSVIGGLTTGLTTWLNQRAQVRAELIADSRARREDLFRDFVVAASKAYAAAIVSSEPSIQDLVALYAMVSRMRILCSPQTVACADKVMRVTTETYFAPNKTIHELNDLIRNGAAIDPLKDFAEAAREDLRAFPYR